MKVADRYMNQGGARKTVSKTSLEGRHSTTHYRIPERGYRLRRHPRFAGIRSDKDAREVLPYFANRST